MCANEMPVSDSHGIGVAAAAVESAKKVIVGANSGAQRESVKFVRIFEVDRFRFMHDYFVRMRP